MSNYLKVGYLEKEDVVESFPKLEQCEKHPIAISECVQEIPCNPCVSACAVKAISMEGINGIPKIDYEKCTGCGMCVSICPGLALFLIHKGKDGYEVTYPDGYKSWSPAKEFEKAYYKLEDPAGDVLKENDIKRFIKDIENVKVGTKTTNTTLTCLTGFEVHGQAACVKPENFDLNVGANYAQIKAEDKIWEGLGFVLQWAKYGLKK